MRRNRWFLFPWSSRALMSLLLVILISLVIVQCLLFWFDSLGQEDTKQVQLDVLRKYTEMETLKPQGCTIPKFRNSGYIDHEVKCNRKIPSLSACKKAKELYANKETPHCGPYQEICTLNLDHQKSILRCHPEMCNKGDILLGTFSPETGELIWYQFQNFRLLEQKFQQLVLDKDPSVEAGMVYIRCGVEDISTNDAENDTLSVNYEDLFNGDDLIKQDGISQQLLIFPNITKVLAPSRNKDSKLNINIVFLDSVSHSHMFRMMPKTVKQLQRMDQDSNFHIFNFELMQSLKGRTFECQQTLLAGLFKKNDQLLLQPDSLFGKLKKHGYDIIWNDDLCWQWEWGLSKNFGFNSEKESLKKRWNAFQQAMRKNKIDSIGSTMSACEILRVNGEKDPFHGLDQVCYNGRYQHSYILEYSKQVQLMYGRANRPYFQFTEFNVGHDDHGLRIKTLDEDLKEYLEYLSLLNNTLTIIFSDHGNTYTNFAIQIDEGHIEVFHPAMFFIAPKNFAHFVGSSGLRGLSVNEHRLISLLDVHFMLMYFANSTTHSSERSLLDYADDIQPRGILDAVSPLRTCHSLPMFSNSKCICEIKSMNTTYTSSRLLLADFAIGTLNNKIQSQYHRLIHGRNHTFGSCQKLQGMTINDVTETIGRQNITQVEMKVLTQPGHPFKDKEVFSFTISIIWHGNNTFNITGFERMSRFSKYDKCADSEVDKRLCICNSHQNKSFGYQTILSSKYPVVFNQQSKINRVSDCLVVFERERQAGLVLDGLNQCSNTSLVIEITGITVGVIMSAKLPARFTLGGSQNLFLVAFLRIGKSDDWFVRYSVKIVSSNSVLQ